MGPLHFVDFFDIFLYLFMVNVARQTSAGLTKNHHSPIASGFAEWALKFFSSKS